MAIELGMAAPMGAGSMFSSVSAVPLGGCDPPLGDRATELELMLDGLDWALAAPALRLDGTGLTPGRAMRDDDDDGELLVDA